MTKTKNFLCLFCVLSLSVLSFSSCEEKMEKENEDHPEVLAPVQIVAIDHAKEMYDFYTDRRVPLIQRYEDSINRTKPNDKVRQEKKTKADSGFEIEGEKFDVARYVSYDYETIKQYLAYIEQEAKKANVEISGLRFYFSNYPDKPFFNNDNKDSILHPRQNSVMLSPTLKKDNREYLFYIGGTEAKQEAVLLTDSFGTVKTDKMGATFTHDNLSYASFMPSLTNSTINSTLNSSFYAGSSLTMNKGTAAPPPYEPED
ncbi:MAG: hypothetical protein WBM98_17895 [Maribacter sp.]|uniref:hypothetical protein n=1 Tax=Maribacter sp. TaxID=1897614 RepID=UPI003C710291